jgi:hypothetical protein
MDKSAVLNIIEDMLKKATKVPGLFDLPKIMSMKSEVQACHSVKDVLAIVESHRDVLAKVFGLTEDKIEQAVAKIKLLEG